MLHMLSQFWCYFGFKQQYYKTPPLQFIIKYSRAVRMSIYNKSSYSLDSQSQDSNSDQLLEEEFNDIFDQGVDPNLCFYKAYCKLHIENLGLLNKIDKIVQDNRHLQKKVRLVAKNTPLKQELGSQENRKKRSRRTAGEISRHYMCGYQICQKSYGSQGSLNQHIKLKHNGVPFSR